MAEINLLARLPHAKRNVKARETAKSAEHIRRSLEYGELYFDGPREYGYGGYRYDGRWAPVAKDIVTHFNLQPGDRVLDVGCAKGFLVKDLVIAGMDAFGLDISRYALLQAEPDVIGRLHLGVATDLPFPDRSFDAVLSINTIHNLDRNGVALSLHEMTRICRHAENIFVQVDAYRNAREKELFESWCLTALTYLTPPEWVELFETAHYKGDYYWTILQAEQ